MAKRQSTLVSMLPALKRCPADSGLEDKEDNNSHERKKNWMNMKSLRKVLKKPIKRNLVKTMDLIVQHSVVQMAYHPTEKRTLESMRKKQKELSISMVCSV